ncbi:guanylate kinase [Carboxylicivirga sp. A043]|uniref:guanylate kinase n=1 Tax=Carboxylicivirga litoralis TaxID=2816963 RepID=UPI0021CB794F|nr:guanylate kinase [Carboxylicivirga sp. A043]MCU4156026.1 guanylate kinase [Carboxylicivirga sp. A043]
MKDFCYHTTVNKTKKEGKLIIFSAPSGSGKSTIVQALLDKGFNLEFSISATSRAPRGNERNGVEYHFLSPDEFRAKIAEGAFLEWEEVYKNTYYGTLKSEVDRICTAGNNIVFDVDVVGGVNIKKMYGDKALSIFVQPPSIEELRNRLTSRGTDSSEKIDMRIAKAEKELTFAPEFDKVIVNDKLEQALEETEKALASFLIK